MNLRQIIAKVGACEDAQAWSKAYKTDLARAWAECDRGDWLIWIAAKAKVDRKLLVACAADIAEKSLATYWKSDDTRPRDLIAVLRRWCANEATIEDVRVARGACLTARSEAWDRYWTQRRAADAYAAADADAAAYAADAADAAADAADAAAYAADAARSKSQKESADIVRARISFEQVCAGLGVKP